MRKTATKSIKLVLITSVLASCAQPNEKSDTENRQRVFMRADSTAAYTEVTDNYTQGHSGGGMGSALLWFMAFRHLGGGFGYANNSLHPQSVAGTNAAKAAAYQAQRGGFGRNAASTTRSSYGS
ncbi:hypothetical protein FXV77_11845 [Sphingobacterium phlebotomi]|uniref:Lipoprotein n=1 Tax=Sphingobacterium phlebotomi TaxID=2605433 RepID=A0A5D4H528_9SPHI|nr:hypothetical protein [Sphingobacterium phlebotomi]TYR35768.1 hypothetical protein FXV77_11845 [Sphingobacterium phlebotomi]